MDNFTEQLFKTFTMKKILFLFLTILFSFNSLLIYAQAKHASTPVPAKPFKIAPNLFSKGPGVSVCDTVNLQAANSWQAYYYTNQDGGYSFGTSGSNGFKINEDANYFDVSAYDYSYISGGLAYFAFANSNIPGDLNKNLIFKVYDDAGGYPGNLLGSTSIKLSQVYNDVQNNYLTQFVFSTPVAMPASKTFYISIDHSNFTWDGTTRDSIAIVANGDDDTTAAAYQYIFDSTSSTNVWFPVNEIYGPFDNPLDINLFIFPYVSNSADGCAILPVSMFNFGGSIKNYQAYLNWSTAAESNNKGFYVERSKDGRNFTTIGFVNGAGNSSKVTNYNYTDISLKDLNVTTTYYRLKQVDLDGKYVYSKVLPLNISNVLKWRLYPNPVKDVATVELNLEAASKVVVQVISRDGKVVLTSDKGIINSGTQQVFINTQNLAAGSYIVRTKVGDKTYSQLLMKE
jgi:type IX secretion system substrate protein